VITDSGQRNVMFRFSRPPENLHYFPLSAPSRLVIDITGPIEALPQVATYKADDPQIEAVRVNSAAGRMRLVVELALDEPPPVSVDTNAAILTARIGRKTAGSQHADAQILFIAENADLTQLAQTPAISSEAQEEPAFPAPESRPLVPATPPSGAASSEASLREEGRAPELASSQPQYSGQKISLHFKDADIRDILRILADVSGLNIVATDDVTGRVTLRLVDVPWDQALAVVLQANGLERVQSGNVVTISTAARLEAERDTRLKAQEAEQHRTPLETVYVKVNYVKATDIVSLVGRQAEPRDSAVGTPRSHTRRDQGKGAQIALMSPRGTMVADGTSNVVIIRDVQENIAAVRELIRNVDVQTPQVLIESYIVAASENINRSLGIQWGYQYAAGPATGKPTGLNFPGRIGVGGAGGTGTGGIPFIANFPAIAAGASTLDLFLGSIDGSHSLNTRLSALESEGKARVVSRPRVVTLNNGEAVITSRREVRVPVTSGNLTVGGAGTSGGGEAFEEFDVGITLKVTPQISSDGFVLLDIEAESSELADSSVTTTANSSTVPRIPDVLSRTTNSQVLIRAGATFVLGGILQDNLDRRESGIPYLRHVPGIGWLFKGKTGRRTKDELLIFLTPKIVAGVSTASLPPARQLWGGRATGEASP
jgi:type IV pilus assembly protein PilQ